MTRSKEKHLPYLTVISGLFWIMAFPLARIGTSLMAQSEEMLGYGSMAGGIEILIASFFVGLVAGMIGFWQHESPKILALLASVLNASALMWTMAKAPL